jgi:SnoaL-like domain
MVTDHEMVRQLLAQYFHGFDARRSDEQWLRSLFTADVTVAFPIGTATDLPELGRLTRRAIDLWGRTLHLVGNEVIALDGERANVAATLHATHLHRDDDPGAPLHIGADIEAEAIRAVEAWKLRRLALELVWTMGDGPSQPAADR